MEKELVLITNRYPFYPGEEFLKLELDFLCEKFRKVHIIPVNSADHTKQRELPHNASVHLVPAFQKKNAVSFKMSAFQDAQGRRWLLEERKRAGNFGLKGFGKLVSWTANAIHLRNYIENIIFKEQNPSKFVAYSYWLSLAPGIAFLKEKYSDLYAISRGHGGDIYDYRHSPPYLPYKQTLIHQLDKIYLISQNGAEYLAEQTGGSASSLEVARLGTQKPEGLSHGSSDGIFRIVSCSYVVPVKRLELLVKSLAECQSRIHWTHIGGGPGLNELEGLAKELPANITTEFTGNMANDEIVPFYLKNPIDLFINVSSSEGIPVAIMEAFSCGIPSVATDVGGTGELVDETNGKLIPKDFEVTELAKLLDHLSRLSFSEKEHLRKSAYQTWNGMYNAEKNYSDFAGEISGYGGTGS
ncbi:glycosyltransferase [Cytobacillus oceanisediminis]|uniref:glycosyltransferase n=1 Tax=Cytobacillus oceanisediminis TaxID=665099 RepID=UPI00164318FB|nr:glycosyltransferase [Cytobacillus oceanisediminis]